ncbi:hypothetical protein [Lachnospira multipara]|uniref:hypothetical protein n=1 Tax=Lachnospira multipara TaxID=28051 RepID=UPI000484D035|nr:hypothetical protein [Lachnospira multipara]
MRKIARGILLLILVTLLGGICAFLYEYNTIRDEHISVAKLYVVPGEANEESLRAKDGGLKEDFAIVFKSEVVISAAKQLAGTSDDIEKYLTVKTVANSNIIELIVSNVDQGTAKRYADAFASTAIKTTSIIPAESIQILSEGTDNNKAYKPGLITKTALLTGLVAAITLVLELLVGLFYVSFRKIPDNDEYYDYEKEHEKDKKNKNKLNKNDNYMAPNVAEDVFEEVDRYILASEIESTKKDESETKEKASEKNNVITEEKLEEEQEKTEEEKIEEQQEKTEEEKIEEQEMIEEEIVEEQQEEKELTKENQEATDNEVSPDEKIEEKREVAKEDKEENNKGNKEENNEEVKAKKKFKIFGRVKK